MIQIAFGFQSPVSVFAFQNGLTQEKISSPFFSEVSSLKNLIPVIVELKKQSSLDFYQAGEYLSMTDREHVAYRKILINYQNQWLSNIRRQGISFVQVGSCTETINMVSLLVKGTDIKKIVENTMVQRIYDDRYLVKPHRSIMAQTTGVERVWKGTNTLKATGKDIIVGVIDTGMEVDHPEFKGKVLGGQNYIDGSSYRTDAYMHGTHVAGIIGGLGDGSHGKGMAPGVKFFSYKALGLQGGATSGIMEAMDKAVVDKCQIINMSLGRVGGEESKTGNPYYSIIKRIVAANVMIVAASGNSGARGKNVPWPAGSPGIVEDSFCVAASNDRNAKMVYSSQEKSITATYNPNFPLLDEHLQARNMVDCSFGRPSDFIRKEVVGKIALIDRGPLFNPISFEGKMSEAKKAGARAVIFIDYNNYSTLFPAIHLDSPLPFISVSSEDGTYLKDSILSDNTNSLLEIKGLSIADFSSMGITPDGAFKPEITAPGVNIMSPVPKRYGTYGASSGTSMACPSIAGQVALIKEVHPNWTVDQIKSAIMNTAYLIMNPMINKPVTFMLQGAGQSIIEKAIQTPAFISPRAFVVENSEEKKIKFTVTNATKTELTSKISVEFFVDSNEEKPIEMIFDKTSISLASGGSSDFTIDIKINKLTFTRPKIEGVIWIDDLHVPFIILRESSVTDNNRALKNPISDIFCSTQAIDYQQTEKPLRVNFSFNTGSEQKFENEISYSNYGNIKVFVTDPQGLLWDPRPVKEFKQCVIGDYAFDWDGRTAAKEYLPNGQFSLKFECSASDDNEIVSKPLYVSNSPQGFVPVLILGAPRYFPAESTFGLDLYVQTLDDLKEIEYTLYFDTKKLELEKAEKTDIVLAWDTPTYKTDSIRLRMNEFVKPDNQLKRIKLATIYFKAKGLGLFKLSNKAYVTFANEKKVRTLGFIPEIQITKKAFLLGDMNDDNFVDLNDYFLLVKSLDTVVGEPLFINQYDINQDLMINEEDLKIILDEIGKQI